MINYRQSPEVFSIKSEILNYTRGYVCFTHPSAFLYSDDAEMLYIF